MTDITAPIDFRPAVSSAAIDRALRAIYACASSTCATRLTAYHNEHGDQHSQHNRLLVCAISQVALGNRAAARRELHALANDVACDAATVGEVIATLAQIGDIRVARDLALAACARFDKNTLFLNRMMGVFEMCADLLPARPQALH